jgi:hypothetical protein
MDHIWTMRLPVLADVLQIEALRQVKVELNGTELPLAAERVVDLQVYFWPVKCPTTFVYLIRNVMRTALRRASVARSQSSSSPTYFSGRVAR